MSIPNWERKRKIPDELPKEMDIIIKELKRSKNKLECLKKAYDIITRRYKGERTSTYLKFDKLYEKDINILWNEKGFKHCTHQNFLLRILLVKSKIFKEEEIRLKKTLAYHFSPHQFMRVKLGTGLWMCVDPWASHFGVSLGDYSHGFNIELDYTEPRILKRYNRNKKKKENTNKKNKINHHNITFTQIETTNNYL